VSVQKRFEPARTSVAESRKFVTEALADCPIDIQDAVILMVSELSTNALMHATTGFAVRIERVAAHLYVEVSDMGEGEPVLQSPRAKDPHGRGLLIVRELSDDWGMIAEPGQPGKAVWFTVSLQRAELPPGDAHGRPAFAPHDTGGQVARPSKRRPETRSDSADSEYRAPHRAPPAKGGAGPDLW
jgi:anti-sigma regulatory factor (Ser/Thr protein kinase)